MVTAGVTMLKLAEYDADTDDSGAVAEDTRAKTVSTYNGDRTTSRPIYPLGR